MSLRDLDADREAWERLANPPQDEDEAQEARLLRGVRDTTEPGVDVLSVQWQVGRLLNTPDTIRWSEERRLRYEEHESRMIFAYFSAEDAGRSRVHIATCERPEQAKVIVATHNRLLAVVEELTRIMEEES